jgi:hypothetical protein
LSRKAVTSTGTWQWMAAVFSFIASSWMMRSTCSADDSVSRMWPVPLQRGQVTWLPSDSAGRRRWRDSSIRPKRRSCPSARGRGRAQRVFQALLDFALVLGRLHVDEVDHDQAAQVAQAQLAGHFVGGFQVGARRGFLDVGALGGARRVHVDATSASVWSITMAPPDGSGTVRE